MRIFSKFHDYYDKAMGFGQDETVHFRRVNRKIDNFVDREAKGLPTLRELNLDLSGRFNIKRQVCLIGFAGNVYPCVRVEYSRINTYRTNVEYFYSPVTYAAFVDDFDEKYRDLLTEVRFEKRKFVQLAFPDLVRQLSPEKMQAIFVEYKTPIWIYGDSYWGRQRFLEINPALKDWAFFKMKDAFTAFQELEMFLNTVLVEERAPAVTDIPDIYKISQKGFDDKLSFRKQKKV